MQLAPLYPILYQILKPSFRGCLWTGAKTSRAIALTFDDGPHPQYTPELLQVLDHYNIKASFFWLGTCVDRSPAVAKTVYERGHWIGLHGYHHHSFPFLEPEALRESLEKTQKAIHTALTTALSDAQASQIKPENIRDVRPPNGLFTPQTLNLLHQWNYRPCDVECCSRRLGTSWCPCGCTASPTAGTKWVADCITRWLLWRTRCCPNNGSVNSSAPTAGLSFCYYQPVMAADLAVLVLQGKVSYGELYPQRCFTRIDVVFLLCAER
jgi:peptidoglycan/xylan/chitin deacetylase (PgdA/CDA1 family)